MGSEITAPCSVVCLGEALIDRLGPPGGDPAEDLPVDDRLGGAPANVACGLARLGTPVAFVGRLGQDAVGEAFSSLFSERGLDTALLQRDAERPSRIVLVRRSRDGERQFQGFAGDEGAGFADQALEPALLPQARWLLIGTLPLAAPGSASALLSAVRQARNQGTAIALDVNWRPTFWDPGADPAAGPDAQALAVMQPLVQQADLLKLAQEEAEWLFHTNTPDQISAALPRRPDVVVTDGGEPVQWCIAGQCGSMPVLAPPQVVDTTGAGDAFTAGLLHQLVSLAPVAGQPHQLDHAAVKEVVRYAAACGALVCAGAGGIDPQPLPSRVLEFLEQV